ncbi:MAG: folylpolyglutamate synthase/dihydrofolate synthase family protein [bacterium]
MNLDLSLKKLYSLHQFGIKLGLDNIIRLLDFIGNPHKDLKTIHIAGSNGKGSTSSFIASILTEAGYKTGLYTSPHFVRFNERIRINGKEIEDGYIVDFMNDLNDYIDEHSPTFFELTTAMAFKYFNENNIDYAVIETGLGGRLDATNVINPLASVITSISLEHTNILGDELAKIAFEKGGIIKNRSKVYLAKLPQQAERVLIGISKERNCEIFHLKDYIVTEEGYLSVRLNRNDYNLYSTPLPGEHQLYNSALAVLTINNTLNIDSVKSYNKGIQNVIKNTGIQCRYERVNKEPMIIFDSAHNSEGVEVFTKEFEKEYRRYAETNLLIGIKNDKDAAGMLNLLNKYFNKIYLTSFENERAFSIEELLAVAHEQSIITERCDDPVQLITDFYLSKPDGCLVVLGSMYLLGKIKDRIMTEKTLDIFTQ